MEKKLLVTVPDENSMDFEAMIALMSIGLDVTIEAPTEAAQQSVQLTWAGCAPNVVVQISKVTCCAGSVIHPAQATKANR